MGPPMPRDGTASADGYRRDWLRYNEALVRRGELYLEVARVESWDDELE